MEGTAELENDDVENAKVENAYVGTAAPGCPAAQSSRAAVIGAEMTSAM